LFSIRGDSPLQDPPPQQPAAAPQAPPPPPQAQYTPPPQYIVQGGPSGGSSGKFAIAFVLIAALGGISGYLYYQLGEMRSELAAGRDCENS